MRSKATAFSILDSTTRHNTASLQIGKSQFSETIKTYRELFISADMYFKWLNS